MNAFRVSMDGIENAIEKRHPCFQTNREASTSQNTLSVLIFTR